MFLPAVEAGFAWLAIIGVVASVVSAVYYLNVIKVIYLDEPGAPFRNTMSISLKGLLTLSGLFTVLFMLVARFPLEWADAAAKSVMQ